MENINEKVTEKETIHQPFSYTAQHLLELIINDIAAIVGMVLIVIGSIYFGIQIKILHEDLMTDTNIGILITILILVSISFIIGIIASLKGKRNLAIVNEHFAMLWKYQKRTIIVGAASSITSTIAGDSVVSDVVETANDVYQTYAAFKMLYALIRGVSTEVNRAIKVTDEYIITRKNKVFVTLLKISYIASFAFTIILVIAAIAVITTSTNDESIWSGVGNGIIIFGIAIGLIIPHNIIEMLYFRFARNVLNNAD
ncbi:MAG: hypothetical protein K6B64_00560 [Acholeplasmatales bacterium]|nr:hypothetical protein [Acholeplasmatales bacterium]